MGVCANKQFLRPPAVQKLHYSAIFVVFCCMQIVNQINARKVHNELNVFAGIVKNKWYIGIELFELFFQVIIMVIPGIRGFLGGLPDEAIYHQAQDSAVLEGLEINGVVPIDGQMRSYHLGRAFGICIAHQNQHNKEKKSHM